MFGSLTHGDGKTFPAHAEPAILHIWQEAHAKANHEASSQWEVIMQNIDVFFALNLKKEQQSINQ